MKSRPPTSVSLLVFASAICHAGAPDYEAEIQRAMKLYSPGDYNRASVTRFTVQSAIVEQSNF